MPYNVYLKNMIIKTVKPKIVKNIYLSEQGAGNGSKAVKHRRGRIEKLWAPSDQIRKL